MSNSIIEKPSIIQGGFYEDHRGILRFVNDFKFNGIKRFYFIKHPDVNFIRAWQGHQFERKYFYPITGSFVIAWVKIDNFNNPSLSLIPNFHIINANKSEIVFIPKGYANGLKALEPDSELMIFSDRVVEESIKEKVRFNPKYWFDWRNLCPLTTP